MMKPLLRVKHLGIFLCLSLSPVAWADTPSTLNIALIGDSEPVFADYAGERDLGFRLGIEYLTNGSGRWAGFDIQLQEESLASDTWEANVVPDANELPEAGIWVGPVQARKSHRIIQYAEQLDRLVLVPATPSDDLPVAGNPHVFRTFYRWQDVEQGLAEWVPSDTPIWVSAVNSASPRPAGSQSVEVSPRSSGALAMEEVRELLSLQSDPVLVNTWPVLLDWLGVLQQEAGLSANQFFTWLPDLSGLRDLRSHPGVYGLTYYYYDLPENEVNDWLVRTMLERHDRLPSQYVVAGMASALAILAAVEEAGSIDPTDLQTVMPDLTWQAPQGEITFDTDGEAYVPFFRTQLQLQPQIDWARPVSAGGDAVWRRSSD